MVVLFSRGISTNVSMSPDDKFVIEVRTVENHGHSAEAIHELLRGTAVLEINERQY